MGRMDPVGVQWTASRSRGVWRGGAWWRRRRCGGSSNCSVVLARWVGRECGGAGGRGQTEDKGTARLLAVERVGKQHGVRG